jgi:hypothetical protein
MCEIKTNKTRTKETLTLPEYILAVLEQLEELSLTIGRVGCQELYPSKKDGLVVRRGGEHAPGRLATVHADARRG